MAQLAIFRPMRRQVSRGSLTSIRQMSRQVLGSSVGEYQAMSRQVLRGSAGEYQADEQAGVPPLSWRFSGLCAGRCHGAQLESNKQRSR